jgi:hypothetical protein
MKQVVISVEAGYLFLPLFSGNDDEKDAILVFWLQ